MGGRGLCGLALLLLLVMARLWSSGFELQSAVAGVEWTAITSGTIDTTTKRSGAACGKNDGGVAPTGGFEFDFAAAAGNGPYFFRACFRLSSLPGAGRTSIMMLASTGGFNGTTLIFVDVDNTGKLWLSDINGDIGGTAAGAITTGVYYRIELKVDRTPASGSHVVEAKLDGTVYATSNTRTLAAGVMALNVGTGFQNGASGAVIFIDDVAINDSTGAAQNGYPGDGKIVHLHPDSAGDNAAWAAGVGGTANWNRVSEVTPDDATTYNQVTVAGNQIDDHNCGFASNAGIGANDTITLVQVGIRGGANGTSTPRDVTARIKSQAAGTVLAGSVLSLSVNGWATNGITAPKKYSLTSYTDPQAGGAWTSALLDAMQIGYQKNTSNANATRVSTVWALVEYVPAAAAPANVPAIISSFMGRF